VGNFIAGTEMKSEVDAGRSVVLDRFYASTMAYILGKKDLDQPLPARGDEAYSWPAELYRPTCMFVLVLPEADRIARRQSRTSVAETDEEKLLRETPAIPQRINAVYEHIGCTRIDIVASDSVEEVVRKVVQAINRETGFSL
jgi:thymidylate kinase